MNFQRLSELPDEIPDDFQATGNLPTPSHRTKTEPKGELAQEELLDFVKNPETIKKAVEGSMEKRAKTLYPQGDKNNIEACVFCKKLADNDIEAFAEGVAMFSPLNPVTPGHKLFVHTKHTKHAGRNPDITAEVFKQAALYAKAQLLPFNLITSAGELATQTVFHLHVHYVPRTKADGLLLPWSLQANANALSELAPITTYVEAEKLKHLEAFRVFCYEAHAFETWDTPASNRQGWLDTKLREFAEIEKGLK